MRNSSDGMVHWWDELSRMSNWTGIEKVGSSRKKEASFIEKGEGWNGRIWLYVGSRVSHGGIILKGIAIAGFEGCGSIAKSQRSA